MFKVQAGAAFDDQYRLIRGYDNGALFGEDGCNLNPTTYLPAPNSTFGCAVTSNAIPSSWTTYWGVTDLNGSGYPKRSAWLSRPRKPAAAELGDCAVSVARP